LKRKVGGPGVGAGGETEEGLPKTADFTDVKKTQGGGNKVGSNVPTAIKGGKPRKTGFRKKKWGKRGGNPART